MPYSKCGVCKFIARESMPDWGRTNNLRLRRPTLYPIELRARASAVCHIGTHCVNKRFGMAASVWLWFAQPRLRRCGSLPRAFFQYIFGHINGQDWLAGYSDGDRVARSGIDLDQFAVALHPQMGEVDVVPEFADHDAVEL